MIKAVLKYEHIDDKIVNYYLVKSDARIVKTEGVFFCRTTIIVGSMKELKEILSILNHESKHAVIPEKARKTINLFGFYI